MHSGIITAISIRQPFVEMILRGNKTIEYRSRKTNIRERVYLYASLTVEKEICYCCWKPGVNVGPNINTSASEWHPFITNDHGSLFFASTRPGGQGRFDIWVSSRTGPGDTDWAPPTNLGPNINTEWFEASPYLTKDNQFIYFEAYTKTFGNLDIYTSHWNGTTWELRTRLPYPVNTVEYDERHPFLSETDGVIYLQ